jgi:hypothetical protein
MGAEVNRGIHPDQLKEVFPTETMTPAKRQPSAKRGPTQDGLVESPGEQGASHDMDDEVVMGDISAEFQDLVVKHVDRDTSHLMGTSDLAGSRRPLIT